MKFPIVNVSHQSPQEEEDILIYVLDDAFIYTDDERVYETYYKNQVFCDSNGVLYKITDRILPKSSWRKALKFLPSTYKVALEFKETNETMDLENLRRFLLERSQKVPDSDFMDFYRETIKTANSFEELMGDKND